jgi:periplasmic divalent cation tolerance protein
MNRPAVIILSTFPSEESAADTARKVVSGRLCACVNFVRVCSIYSWKGKLEEHQECLTLFKTTAKSSKMLKAKIAKSHPYRVPEIVELKMNDVSKPYLSWLAMESSPERIAQKRHNTAKG